MYTNIPTEALPNMLLSIMEAQSTDTEYSRHILSLVQIVLRQNYFQHGKELFQQKEGLAMGAPTSSILSEVYLQNLEHNSIFKILMEQNIVAYFRYVDVILIVYDKNKTNISHMLDLFNKLHPKLKFTMELEEGMMINFLDITIYRRPTGVYASIYRKPTASGSLIHFDSCHPIEHQLAGINYLVNRIALYPVPAQEKELEIQISQQSTTMGIITWM
jgi:hypothetical protein